MADTIIRINEVADRVGLSKSTIRRLVRAGLFPTPVLLAERAQGFRSSQIEKWIADREEVKSEHGDEACTAA